MSRYRRNSGGRRGLLVVIAIVVATAALQSSAFTNASLLRDEGLDVVPDPDGAVGLEVASNVTKDSVDPLVNVTDNLDQSVTVTVALRNGGDGDLYLDGANVGDSTTFTLAPGQRQQVEVDANNPNTDLQFDVTASATELTGEFPRSTSVEPPGGGGPPCDNPPCGPPCGTPPCGPIPPVGGEPPCNDPPCDNLTASVRGAYADTPCVGAHVLPIEPAAPSEIRGRTP